MIRKPERRFINWNHSLLLADLRSTFGGTMIQLTLNSVLALTLLILSSCRSTVDRTDHEVATVIAERQQKALDQQVPLQLPVDDNILADPPPDAYLDTPSPVSSAIPPGFEPSTTEVGTESAPAEMIPATPSGQVFTLTDALAYAQQHRRPYQSAKEDLYLVALSLTLERHLWTPIFASTLRTVYGNFGEITDFDQAMRFVADLSVSQRLPYGGEFTASAVSTLIRDVGQTITAEEGSTVKLEVTVPFLRNAGHVAREELIQLERELTYAVRAFERFRRQQLVTVATAYFDLLRSKQTVLDNQTSLEQYLRIFKRAQAFEERDLGSLLETQRAEFEYLSADNRLERSRESFRAQADRFKLLIGMPVDQPLGLNELETIEAIEKQIVQGKYPLLRRPAAVNQEARALEVAMDNRLDLLTLHDRIDDARRGVAIAKNALLPDLDLISSVTWETDPSHYRLGDYSFDRTSWRSELVLGLPLERTSERNRYRSALIDVRGAQRDYEDALERIRAEVRSAVNQIRLEDRSLEIQRRNIEVVEKRLEYTTIRYNDGDLEIRELLDAKEAWNGASNDLNFAKTSSWTALLGFRLATETLRIDENGVQHPTSQRADHNQ